jgi:hypothetical protein
MVSNEESVDLESQWLKRLQQNSWEVELLISGGAIFTLFQILKYLL